MDRGRSLTSTIPSVGSGTYSPGPNMARSPDEEGSNEECRCHHGPGLPRPQKPCYSVDFVHVYRGVSPMNWVFFPTATVRRVHPAPARRVFQRDQEIQSLPKGRCFLLQNCGNPK